MQPLKHTHTQHAHIHTLFSALQEHKLKAYKAARTNGKSCNCLVASQEEMREPAGDISSSCRHFITQCQVEMAPSFQMFRPGLKDKVCVITNGFIASSYNETLQPNNQLPFTRPRVRSRQQQMMIYNLMEGRKGKVGRGARLMKRV